jgi:hypothetical protein
MVARRLSSRDSTVRSIGPIRTDLDCSRHGERSMRNVNLANVSKDIVAFLYWGMITGKKGGAYEQLVATWGSRDLQIVAVVSQHIWITCHGEIYVQCRRKDECDSEALTAGNRPHRCPEILGICQLVKHVRGATKRPTLTHNHGSWQSIFGTKIRDHLHHHI